MKVCNECKKEYEGFMIHSSSKYCGSKCRQDMRIRVNAESRKKAKEKEIFGNKEFIGNSVFLKYRLRAPKRGLEFTLTKEFFIKNVGVNCFYCDDIIEKVGFDRVNNDVGYIESNCVPCCFICNIMKRSQTQDDFLKKVLKISNNLKKVL